jgi:hypothetical protein
MLLQLLDSWGGATGSPVQLKLIPILLLGDYTARRSFSESLHRPITIHLTNPRASYPDF